MISPSYVKTTSCAIDVHPYCIPAFMDEDGIGDC